MGEEKLEQSSEHYQTQTVCFSSIEKENGSSSTRKMGKIQSGKSGLDL